MNSKTIAVVVDGCDESNSKYEIANDSILVVDAADEISEDMASRISSFAACRTGNTFCRK